MISLDELGIERTPKPLPEQNRATTKFVAIDKSFLETREIQKVLGTQQAEYLSNTDESPVKVEVSFLEKLQSVKSLDQLISVLLENQFLVGDCVNIPQFIAEIRLYQRYVRDNAARLVRNGEKFTVGTFITNSLTDLEVEHYEGIDGSSTQQKRLFNLKLFTLRLGRQDAERILKEREQVSTRRRRIIEIAHDWSKAPRRIDELLLPTLAKQ